MVRFILQPPRTHGTRRETGEKGTTGGSSARLMVCTERRAPQTAAGIAPKKNAAVAASTSASSPS